MIKTRFRNHHKQDSSGRGKGIVRGAILLAVTALASTSTLAAFNFTSSPNFELGGDVRPKSELVDDFNGDGIDDIILSIENKVMILLGTKWKAKSFKKGATIRHYYPVTGLTTGDFNGDGATDISVLTYYGKVFTYLNKNVAPLAFSAPKTFKAINNSVFQATDFNGDGNDDLIVGLKVYLNDGKGQFTLSGMLPTKDTTGDINGDGEADVIGRYGDISCGLGGGDFELCASVTINSGIHAAADLNALAGLGIVSWTPATYGQVARTYTTDHCGTGRTYRKLSGTRYVIRGNQYRRTTGCRWTTTRNQTVVATSSLAVSSVALDGTKSEWVSDDMPGIIGDIQLADFNGDGFLDVLASNDLGNNFVFVGSGDGTFLLPEAVTAAGNTNLSKLIVGDWNGDGSSDLAWIVTQTGQDTQLYAALSGVKASTTAPTPPVAEPQPAPAPTPSTGGETVEVSGSVEAFGNGYFVVNGITVSYDAAANIKFEDNTSGHFEIGQFVEGKVTVNADGSAYPVKIQVGG